MAQVRLITGASGPARPVRAASGLGRRSRTLLLFALTASFAVFTYAAYAQSAVPTATFTARVAVHVRR